ncbi:MAG TPA: nucleoside phosphorylase [Phototrophicaceae bacterium]|nr:nucleoside phosphorylase [Phototrophicaceae bacterium]
MNYPILEFDPTQTAFIEPRNLHTRLESLPERCVLCFFNDVIASVFAHTDHIHSIGSEIGRNPIYVLEQHGQRLTVIHPGVGAPLAAAFLEDAIALGCRKFIACGGAGALRPEITLGHLVVPNTAVRDEGTSYHYLPPGREVSASPEGISAIRQTLEAHEVPYVMGKTWTTDAIYRETPAKIAARRAEGCLTVEMEAAAFFAVTQFRRQIAETSDVSFAQILYGGDDLSGDLWDRRGWDRATSTREQLFWLAAEACLRL